MSAPLVSDTAMVLAAGLGKRMRPLTATQPKPMVRVGGKPLIDHALDRLTDAGVSRAVVNVHYLADSLEAHLASRRLPQVSISDERSELLEKEQTEAAALEAYMPAQVDRRLVVPTAAQLLLLQRVQREQPLAGAAGVDPVFATQHPVAGIGAADFVERQAEAAQVAILIQLPGVTVPHGIGRLQREDLVAQLDDVVGQRKRERIAG